MNRIFFKSSEKMNEINDESVDLIITSPPYNIKVNYGNKTKKGKIVESKSIKYEDNLSDIEYRNLIRNVMDECYRVLKKDGSLWVNLKNKYRDGVIIPPHWIVDFLPKMYLKNIVIWAFDWGGSTNKRLAPRYEYFFWFTKSKEKYKFNLNEIKIPAVNFRPDRYKNQLKNPSDVWYIPLVSGNFIERTGHPAQYPEKLVGRIISACSAEGDLVLDPFLGSGTTAVVAKKNKRNYIGYEIIKEYIEIAEKRISGVKI